MYRIPAFRIKKYFLMLIAACLIASCGVAQPTPPVKLTSVPVKDVTMFKNTVVTLTFDDGNQNNYLTRQVLKQNNLRATFYVVSGFTGTAGYMTEKQLRTLAKDGNEIGGHTLSHVNLTTVQGDDLKREICEDRQRLISFGLNPVSFAYPFGHYNAESRQTVMDCGYLNARAVSNGPASIPPHDSFAIPSMPYMVQDTTFAKMTRYVAGLEAEGGGWAIFVFHHICDGCDKYAVSLDTFVEFAQWLGAQQKNGLQIKTMGEVMSAPSASSTP